MRFSKLFALAFAVLGVITLPGCWSQFRGNAAHTGYNPYEHILGPENVGAGLLPAWTGAKDAAGDPMGPISSSPAVAALLNGSSDEYVFIGSEDGYLYAFNALGCGGSLTCGPVWQSPYLGAVTNSSPALATEVINGVQTSVVYIASNFGIAGGIFALNAATGAQIWTNGMGGLYVYSSPNVVNGLVYVLSGDLFGAVFAFDATTGVLVWSGVIANDYPSPAVANGDVYAGDVYGFLSAFDANGCNGRPFCSPLWMGVPVGQGGRMDSSPAVANALVNGNQNPVVYVGSDDGYLYAFDANGIINCTIVGGTQACRALWVGATGGGSSSPAVAPPTAAATNGVVYVGGLANSGNNLYAFDANGVINCTIVGGTQTCQPLWVGATNGFVQSSPAVANGVVYVGSSDGSLYAFAAAGCGKSVCSPLSTFLTNDNGGVHGNSSPAVSGGLVYIGSSDGYLYVIGPPPACAYSPPFC